MSDTATIQLANIESELSRMWTAYEKEGKTKASLFNLIVYTQEEERAGYFRDLVARITQKFPCRIIFIEGSCENLNDHLYTCASVENSGRESSSLIYDLITVKVSGKHLERVPFIILPHILPDLPIYLLWGLDPSQENTIFPHLKRFSKRVIFDSECSNNLKEFSKNLLCESVQKNYLDLNWARISGWRMAISQAFSDEKIEQIKQTKRIQIQYNSHTNAFFNHTKTQALYLQAWLAAQLHWKYESIEEKDGHIRICYSFDAREIVVLLSPQNVKIAKPGALLSLKFTSMQNDTCLMQHDIETSHVNIQFSSDEKCEIPYNLLLANPQKGLSLVQEMFYAPSSNHYKNMLQALSQIEVPSC